MKYLIFAFFIVVASYSCKQENLKHQSEGGVKKLSFSAVKNIISLDDAIDSVVVKEVISDEIVHFALAPGLNIAAYPSSLYVDANNRNELLSVTYDGKVSSVVKGGYRDTIFPKELRFFCVTPDSQNIFVIDPVKRCLFKYSPKGSLIKVIKLPMDEHQYYRVFALSEAEFILVILSNARDDEKGRRDSTHVASIFNIETNHLKRLYVKGGSPSRDRIVMANWYKGDGKIIYNYQNSTVIHEVSDGHMVPKYEVVCPEHITDEDILDMDNQYFGPQDKVTEKLYKSGKIVHIFTLYETNHILFFEFSYNSKPHWVFYNVSNDEFKVIKFKNNDRIVQAKGRPITPFVQNGYKNSLLHFVDGEELQNIPGIKDKYDPNKSYLVRIYPKYLNQAAWEK